MEEEEAFAQLAVQVARDLHLRRLDEAARGVQQLLVMSPQSTTALEMEGDVLSAKGDAKGAREAYKRALAAEPANADAERKYAELALQLGQADWDREALLAGDLEHFKGAPHKAPAGAALRSLLFPGLGQLYNGDSELGVVLALLGTALLVGALTLIGIPLLDTIRTAQHQPGPPPSPWSWLVLVALLGLYVYSAYEAYKSAPTPTGKI